MMASLDRGTTIGRLQLRADAADPHALRMRGGLLFRALDLAPPGMPEQAILCIRRLRDPLPGALELRSSAAPRPVAWEAAARSAVGEAMRRAARPALGPVPSTADAVLFADRAELLACAARDACVGALAASWWWRHLIGGERSFPAVVREWTRAPAYVPAAVELLAARGEIVAFAAAVPPGEAVVLVETVLRTHALPALAFAVVDALSPGPGPPPRAPGAPEQARRVVPAHAEGAGGGTLAGVPAWASAVPEAISDALTVEQRCFLAITLLIRRAPATVRAERFARDVVAWIEQARRRERWPGTIGVPAAPEARPAGQATIGERRSSSPEHGELPTASPPPANERQREPHRQAPPRALAPAPPGDAVMPAVAHALRGGVSEAAGMVMDSERREAMAAPPPAALEAVTRGEAGADAPRPDVVIESDFAGVFFLLNVAVALELYSDFTSAVQCGLELDVWDFLALTGRAIAGDDFEDDPLRPLLAALANRGDGEEPGRAFAPAGGPSLHAWLEATVERITERIALAGIDSVPRVVRRYGRITTSPAHLDVYCSLAAHPIEIRMAGLDRDPGWIPAAGRHITFHFD